MSSQGAALNIELKKVINQILMLTSGLDFVYKTGISDR